MTVAGTAKQVADHCRHLGGTIREIVTPMRALARNDSENTNYRHQFSNMCRNSTFSKPRFPAIIKEKAFGMRGKPL